MRRVGGKRGSREVSATIGTNGFAQVWATILVPSILFFVVILMRLCFILRHFESFLASVALCGAPMDPSGPQEPPKKAISAKGINPKGKHF